MRLPVLFPLCAVIVVAQSLSHEEAQAARLIDRDAPAAVRLLEQIVNINSGTYNPSGVTAVGEVLEPQFRALGFSTRWINMDAVKRAPHLVAERKGNRGKRIL